MEKYIEVDFNNAVSFVHYAPFDPRFGLGKTRAELRKTGYIVEDMPVNDYKEGYTTTLHYDGKEFYFTYTEVPKTDVEVLQQENKALKLALAELAEANAASQMTAQLALAELAENNAQTELTYGQAVAELAQLHVEDTLAVQTAIAELAQAHTEDMQKAHTAIAELAEFVMMQLTAR